MSIAKALIIGGGSAIAIVVGVKFYSWGKNKIAGANNTTPIPTTTSITLTKMQGDAYAARVINQIGGWSGGIFSSDDKVFTELLNMTDANLVFVSNCFDTDFTDQNQGKNLAKYISDNDNASITWDDSAKLVSRLGQIIKQ